MAFILDSPVEMRVNPTFLHILTFFNDDICNDANTKEEDIYISDVGTSDIFQLQNYAKKSFEEEASFSIWDLFVKPKKEKIMHKNINPMIFEILDVIEERIIMSVHTKIDLTELKWLFRLTDRGMEYTDLDYKSFKLSKLCTFVKKYILETLDGLFSNLVSRKLIKLYFTNKDKYEDYLSYMPFAMSDEELKLLTKLFDIFKLIDKYYEYTQMTVTGLLRLFSLVLFDGLCFTTIGVVEPIGNILIDIFNINLEIVPRTLIKNMLNKA